MSIERVTKWFAKWTLRLLFTHTFLLIGTSLYMLFLFESSIQAIWDDVSEAANSQLDIDQKIAEVHWQASELWFLSAAISLIATLLTSRTRATKVPAAIAVALASAVAAFVVVTTQIEWDIVQSQTLGMSGYWRALFLDDTTIVLGNGTEVSLNQQRWLFTAYVALSAVSATAVLMMPRLLHRPPAGYY